MASPESHHQITAIIPAYNEADRVGAVLDVVTTYPGFSEVIVIDDGSSDATASVVRTYPITYLRNQTNRGKGYAMDRAVRAAHGDIIFFCDADVRGLSHAVIQRTLAPVLSNQVDMCIAMRNRKIYYLRFVLAVIPLLGGERALTKKLWLSVPDRYKDRFMIEAALNFYAKHFGRGFTYIVFRGLSQTVKEKKYGLLPGFTQRIQMFYEIIKSNMLLHLTNAPKPHLTMARPPAEYGRSRGSRPPS